MVFTLLAPHLEGVLIVSGPKLPKTGGKSTDDPLVIARDNYILVNVYTQLIKTIIFLSFLSKLSNITIKVLNQDFQ